MSGSDIRAMGRFVDVVFCDFSVWRSYRAGTHLTKQGKRGKHRVKFRVRLFPSRQVGFRGSRNLYRGNVSDAL